MSVLKVDRKESKFEPITYSDELRDMLTELIQHSFGIHNPEYCVRKRYESKENDPNEFWQYSYLIHNSKNRVDQLSALLTHNVCAANSIYPTNMEEYQKRRAYQNYAIVNCQQIIKELQRLIEVFNVDISLYKRHVEALQREIKLIKRWRQRDNKLKSFLKGDN